MFFNPIQCQPPHVVTAASVHCDGDGVKPKICTAYLCSQMAQFYRVCSADRVSYEFIVVALHQIRMCPQCHPFVIAEVLRVAHRICIDKRQFHLATRALELAATIIGFVI